MKNFEGLEDFFKHEFDEYVKKVLKESLEEARSNNLESKEIVFNEYIVVIKPKENEVEIINDIFPKDPIVRIPLDEFFKAIEDIH